MKPFQFTLESVRTLRLRKERESMERYALALAARQRAAERVELVSRQLMEVWMRIQGELADGSNASSVTQLRRFCESLEQSQSQAKHALDEADLAVHEALGKMLASRQEREAVDKFFQYQKNAYDRELNREEQKLLDEMAGRKSPVWALGKEPQGSNG